MIGDSMDYLDAYEIYRSVLEYHHGDIAATIEEMEVILADEPNVSELIGQLRGNAGGVPSSLPGTSPNPWYSEDASHEYWKAYRALLSDPGRRNLPKDAVDSIDITSFRIVDHLFDPNDMEAEPKYGLVVGHVQSGKTANYTGVIARAADAGYKVIVVLTGGASDLRNQTQKRLSKELTGTLVCPDGCNVDDEAYNKKWHEVTTQTITDNLPPNRKVKDEGDVSGNLANKDDSFFDDDLPILIVMKKIVASLDPLIEWLSGISEEQRYESPLLLIDDECDYASVNNNAQNATANAINALVRTTLSLFPRRAYVGYTATPFANVFAAVHGDQTVWPTLYPRDFIFSLPEPREYLGFPRLFPQDPHAESSYPFSRLCEVEEAEAQLVRSLTDVETVTSQLGSGLKDALRDHLITSAIRGLRLSKPKHQTMLVHTQRLTGNMHPVVLRIKRQIEQWKPVIRNNPDFLMYNQPLELQGFIDRYQTEFVEKWNYPEDPPDFNDIKDWITRAYERNAFRVLELSSDEVYATNDLDYDSQHHNKYGLNVIAVGGQRLSRGLTLEGLTISYFIRTATRLQYDTLMQMGRWFGYRIGFEDLVRIHSTPTLITAMTDLGRVENDLRTQIERYQHTGLSPTDFGVRVLSIMNMFPTRPAAMSNLSQESMILDASIIPAGLKYHFQNPKILKKNLEKAANLLTSLGDYTRLHEKTFVWEDVDNQFIIDYMDKLHQEDSGYPDNIYRWNELNAYIERRIEAARGEFDNWTVALLSKETGEKTAPMKNYGCDLEIVMAERSRYSGSNSIGAAVGPRDTVIGLPGVATDYYSGNRFSNAAMWAARDSTKPLLLLYVFNKDSTPKNANSGRTNLFIAGEEKVDLVTPIFVIPTANMTEQERIDEAIEYLSNAELPSTPPDNLDEPE